jgi:hypothetical protein
MPKQNRNRKSLVSEVADLAEYRLPGFKSWFDSLPDDARAELATVRDAFLHGELRGRQKRSVANAVMAVARERGWRTSGIQGVIAWLDAKP